MNPRPTIPTPAPSSCPPSTSPAPPPAPSTARGQAGQSTVEYALILLGAAAVALVVVAWVTQTDLIGRLFDTVVGQILRQAS
jgi:uncharacterized protein HemX